MSEAPYQLDPQKYRLALRRPVTMAMLFLTLVVFGVRSYQQLPINLMPDISYPTLTVRTEYEGAAPEDVEKLVTRPLEEMLSIVSGLVEISSVSSAGLSEIILEFKWGTEMNVAQQDVRDRLDLFDPPKEVTEKPVILRFDPTLDPVMRVAITPGDFSRIQDARLRAQAEQAELQTIRDAAERHVKSDLEAEAGIAQVAVKGGREEEIQILVDAQRLKNLGLPLDAVVTGLAQRNINLSGGRLQEGKTEYLVRTLNEFTTVEQIGDSILSTPGGDQFRLRDVADVLRGAKERKTAVIIDGQEAVALDVFKEGDANTVSVCRDVRDLLGFKRPETAFDRFKARISEQIQRSRGSARGLDGGGEVLETRSAKRNLLDRLPSTAKLTIISDQSRFIQGSIDEVRNATITGGVLALVVLFLFLRELKTTAVIGIAIPISVIAAFVPMFSGGISLNIMSLGGLALGVGMLVDNSIVVLESIFRCREEGDSVLDAAERGTREVSSAVVASTLTTVCVFFPIAFVEGISGQLFKDLALTVTFSLLASLLVALYLNPLLASLGGLVMTSGEDAVWALRAYREGRASRGPAGALAQVIPAGVGYAAAYVRTTYHEIFDAPVSAITGLRGGVKAGGLLKALAALVTLPFLAALYLVQLALRLAATVLVTALFLVSLVIIAAVGLIRLVLMALLWLPLRTFDLAFNTFRNAYGIALAQSLRFSPVILLAMAALSFHVVYIGRELGTELIPPMKQGEFGIRMEARPGTRLDETIQLAAGIQEILLNTPEVDTVTVEIGEESASSESDRGENVAEFTVLLKNPDENAARQDEIIEGLRGRIAEITSDEITFTLPSLFSFKTAVELQLIGDDLQELRRVGTAALREVEKVPGVRDAELSAKPGYPEVIVELDRELLASRGISPGQVAQRLRTEVQGEVATRFNESGQKIDVRVRTDQRLLKSVEDLRQLSISDGTPPVPLHAVASIRVQEGPSEVRRIDQRQVVLITANVEGQDLGAVSRGLAAAVASVPKPKDYYFLLGGQNRELETSQRSLYFALALAIFLVYVVMACQFESILHPALVMFSVPLAFIGVVYALWWTGTDLSIMVFLGGIVLAGIVVNNAIVLVDYINQLRARGHSKAQAVVEAGTVRLRPIMMTTITTVLGLLPMISASGEGAELRQPMAITIMAGLSSSTLLTLFVIPMVYYLFGGRDPVPQTAENGAAPAEAAVQPVTP